MFQRDLSFVHKYFTAEKQAGLIFMIIGIIAIILSVLFYFLIKSNPAFYKGAAIVLCVVGLLMGVVGFTVFNRSDAQRKHAAYAMGIDPGFVKNEELPRMKKVMTNFTIIRYIEIFLAVGGLIMFFYFRNNNDKQLIAGLGIALTVLAIIAFVADQFAHHRGAVYTNALENFMSAK